jgi:hypothetical protein
MLSFAPGQRDVARSRLRSALDWMIGWSRLPGDAKKVHRFRDDDIAEVALGLVNTDGPQAAVDYLKRWTPATAAYRAGRIVATRLIETGRVEQLDGIVTTAADNPFIQMAVLYQAGQSDLTLGYEAAGAVLTTLKRRRKPLDVSEGRPAYGQEYDLLCAIVAAVTAAAWHGQAEPRVLLRILTAYLPAAPPRGLGDRLGTQPDVLLKAFALKAYFERREFADRDLLHPALIEELENPKPEDSRELGDFKRNITPAVPWARIWVRVACAQEDDVQEELEQAAEETYTRNVSDYQTPWTMLRVVARLSAQILSRNRCADLTAKFHNWLQQVEPFLSWSTRIDVIQHAAHADHMDEVVFMVAARLDESISQARTQASEKISTFTELARAIRPASPDEARAFFGRAIDTADKIGDDVMQRWDAISALARQAATAGEDGERAYLTARTFEALAEYLDGAAAEQEQQCIQTVASLSLPGAIALAARWRSRRFGSPARVLEGLLKADTGLAARVPLAAAALLPLAETFDVRGVVEQALSAGLADPALLFEVVSNYDRTAWHPIEYFEQIDALAHRFSVNLDDTSYARSSYQHRLYDAQKHSSHYSSRLLEDATAYEARRETGLATLKALDLSNPDSLEQAHRMCDDREYGVHNDDLIDAVLTTPMRHLHKVIYNLQHNIDFNSYTYRSVLERLTAVNGLPRAAVDAMRDLAMHAVRRFCDQIAAASSYQALPLDLLGRATGKQPQILYDLALNELGTRHDFLDAQRCFGLVYSLAPRLSAEDAREAFDQAITELGYLNDANTADGPWTKDLIPPTDLYRCVAGYIWSALADPAESIRWRAAHAVHMLCRLGATAELEALAKLANTASARPFSDAQLHFYDKDATLWLFLAVERASVDAAGEIKPFEALLRQATFSTETHVLLREAARRALTTLDRNGLVSLDNDERDRLARLNQPIGYIEERVARPSWGQRSRTVDEHSYKFYFDFEDHWIERLAECFGLSLEDVTRLTSDVITESWAVEVSEGHVQDSRHIKKILQEERTYYYKSEIPAVHDLDFYLSFHALMTVAGHLVDTRPVQVDPYDNDNAFTNWIKYFRPTRPDGRWLTDRRDAMPPDQTTLLGTTYRRDICTEEVRREDLLDRLFNIEHGMITVCEWSEQAHENVTEIVTIDSALVEPSRAMHLLAAWQTSENPWFFKIPTAGGDDELDVDRYRLVGWIEDYDLINYFDERDPLANGVHFPGPRPSAQACQWLDIAGDADHRVWSRDGEKMMTCSVWSDMREAAGRSSGSRGQRLTTSLDSLRQLTDAAAMSMIFKVTIERRNRDAERDRDESDESEARNLNPHFKVLIYDRQLGFVEL